MHLMIDLETLATSTDAAVLTIGACKFDPKGDDRDKASRNVTGGGKRGKVIATQKLWREKI